MVVAARRDRLVRALQRLPLRPEHGHPRRLEGDGRGREGRTDAGPGALYFVDVSIRRATWAERAVAVPAAGRLHARAAQRGRAAGLVVRGAPRGRAAGDGAVGEGRGRRGPRAGRLQGSPSATAAPSSRPSRRDVPAATEARTTGDVIVAARGRPIRTPGRAPQRVHGRARRATTSCSGCGATARSRTVHRARPSRHRASTAGRSSGSASRRPRTSSCRSRSPSTSARSAARPQASRSRSTCSRSSAPTSTTAIKVVATGEMELDGTVGPIGGVKQKTYGARRAGADVFLVPAGENAAEARRYAGNLRIIPVESFQQALSALSTLPPN